MRCGGNSICLSFSGETPLMAAVGTGDVQLVKVVCALGVDVQCADKKGRTALHVAAVAGGLSYLRIFVRFTVFTCIL